MKNKNSDSDVYVKLDRSDSLEAKRNLLEMTGSAINLQMIADKIKKLSKEEISERSDEKKQLKMMIVEINQLLETMPKIKIEKHREEKAEVPKKEKIVKVKEQVPEKTRKTLNDELQEVKKKIEGLKSE